MDDWTKMRTHRLYLVLAAALIFCAGAFAADSSPLDIVLSGPRAINPGGPMQITATLINRSSRPVVIALPGAGGIAYFNYSWKVTDPEGNTPMRKARFSFPPEPDVTDGNFVVLQPGQSYQLPPVDPSADLMLAPSATYTVRLAYRYHQDWSVDYLRQHVSPQMVSALAATPSIFAASEPFTVAVRPAPTVAASHSAGQ